MSEQTSNAKPQRQHRNRRDNKMSQSMDADTFKRYNDKRSTDSPSGNGSSNNIFQVAREEANHTHKDAIIELQERLKQVSQHRDDLQRQLDSIAVKGSDDHAKEFEDIKKQLIKNQRLLTTIKANEKTLVEDKEKFRHENAELKQRLSELESRVETISAHPAAAANETTSTDERERLRAAEATIAQLRSQLAELDVSRARYKEATSTLEVAESRLKEEYQQLCSKWESFEKESTAEINAAKSKLVSTEKELAALRKENDDIKRRTKSEVESIRATYEGKVREAVAAKDDIEQKFDKLKKERDQLKKERDQRAVERDNYGKERDTLRTEVEKLQKALTAAQKSQQKSDADAQKSEAAKKAHDQEVNQLRAQIKELEQALENAKSVNAALDVLHEATASAASEQQPSEAVEDLSASSGDVFATPSKIIGFGGLAITMGYQLQMQLAQNLAKTV